MTKISPDHDTGTFQVYMQEGRKADVYVNEEYHIKVEEVISLIVFLARQGVIRGWLGALISRYMRM